MAARKSTSKVTPHTRGAALAKKRSQTAIKPAASKAGKAAKAAPRGASKTKPAAGKHATQNAAPKAETKARAAAGQGEVPESASHLIDQRILNLGDWRGETLARMRALIQEAEPEVIEEWKWMGTPVWSHNGIICTGESYKKVVKLTFAKGASLPDPKRLFNSSLEGNTRRAIDIPEGTQIDAGAFKALVKAAAALNAQAKKKR